MMRAARRGCVAGLVVGAVLLLPFAALSWLVDRMDKAEEELS